MAESDIERLKDITDRFDLLITRPVGHSDERRSIIDVTPRIRIFTVRDSYNIALGNHYRKLSTETLHVLYGSLDIILVDTENGNRVKTRVLPYSSLVVPPKTAYVVFPEPRTQFLAILDRDFDLGDMVKYPIEVNLVK